jgi:hypothetical protein
MQFMAANRGNLIVAIDRGYVDEERETRFSLSAGIAASDQREERLIMPTASQYASDSRQPRVLMGIGCRAESY